MPEHKEFKRFVESLIEIDPGKRPSAKNALRHEFLSMDIPAEYEELKVNLESKSTKHSSSMPKGCKR
jgi:serine/threonine protein kinase